MNLTSYQSHYRMRIIHSLKDVEREIWDYLVSLQANPNPFLSYAFLHALHESGGASETTGWRVCYLTLWDDHGLAAALPLYEKTHSYGEYVFDWAWAEAYQRNGLNYYPKLLSAIPFTPVTGSRLLARDTSARHALLNGLACFRSSGNFSSTHILFSTQQEARLLHDAGYLIREGLQFHWKNQSYHDFEHFLSTLEQKKRKNIRAERRKVAEQGVTFRQIQGKDITEADWIFFKSCYDQTYLEHRSTPYLNLNFFLRIGTTMPEHLHLIIARRNGKAIASSLIVHNETTVFGRYWGALDTVPCLHFETAYYQAIEFCIEKKIENFEGGAQGEHKIARGFLPKKTYSAHHLSEPAFADAVALFLQREKVGIEQYMNELNEHNPFKTDIDK
jgi:predicted N-acyltransferase